MIWKACVLALTPLLWLASLLYDAARSIPFHERRHACGCLRCQRLWRKLEPDPRSFKQRDFVMFVWELVALASLVAAMILFLPIGLVVYLASGHWFKPVARKLRGGYWEHP